MHESSRSATVSVVIPLYNKAAYILPTLQTVLDQSRAPNEILVVDDGSTDDGPALVAALNDPRIRLIATSRPQSGPSAARNTGIRAAQGQWIALLDADDFWLPNFLERLLGLLAEMPPAICAFSGWDVLYAHDKRHMEPYPPTGGTSQLLDLDGFLALWLGTGQCPMWTSATIIARDTLLAAGGFPEEHWRGEDKDTWLRVMAQGPAIYTPDHLAVYNKAVEGQITKEFKPLLHPVTATIHRMLADHSHAGRAAALKRLSNLMIWQYTRMAAFRSHLPASFVTRFHPSANPLRFATVTGVFAATRMGVIRRARAKR